MDLTRRAGGVNDHGGKLARPVAPVLRVSYDLLSNRVCPRRRRGACVLGYHARAMGLGGMSYIKDRNRLMDVIEPFCALVAQIEKDDPDDEKGRMEMLWPLCDALMLDLVGLRRGSNDTGKP